MPRATAVGPAATLLDASPRQNNTPRILYASMALALHRHNLRQGHPQRSSGQSMIHGLQRQSYSTSMKEIKYGRRESGQPVCIDKAARESAKYPSMTEGSV